MSRRKRWPAVEVEWFDCHGGGDGWIELEPHHAKPRTIRTVGLLARESKTCLVVVGSHDAAANLIGGYTTIPKVNVVKVRYLTGQDA